MKAPLSWLQDFVDINVDIETLTRTMIMHGLGIEGIERVYGAYDSIVVGKLLKIMPHENSDHLQICTVTTGDETLQIVTGAPNVYEGMVCPVAKVGTVMPSGNEIQAGCAARRAVCRNALQRRRIGTHGRGLENGERRRHHGSGCCV